MKNNIVQLIDVSKQFRETDRKEMFTAVKNINLEINQREFFTLLGPSGCGKTTTLRLIAGFESPSSGKIIINGKDCTDIPPYKRPVHTVFQNYALFPHMTVEQNVAYGLNVKRVPKEEQNVRVQDALSMVQMSRFGKRKPAQLSGGEQQRVALARALVNNPEVILLDEPLGALDLKLRKEMQWELKQLQQEVDITFIYVTHDQEEALSMSNRIAVLSEGGVIQIGPPDEIYNFPNSRFVASFIGDTNFLEIELDEANGFRGTFELGGKTIQAEHPDDQMLSKGRGIFAIRPEKIKLLPPRAEKTGDYAISGKIINSVFIGTDIRYMVRIADGRLMKVLTRVNGDPEKIFDIDQDVQLSFHEQDALILTE